MIQIVADPWYEQVSGYRRWAEKTNCLGVGRWPGPVYQVPGIDPDTGAAAVIRRGYRSGYLSAPGGGLVVRGPALHTVGPILAPWSAALPTNEPDSYLFQAPYMPENPRTDEYFFDRGIFVQGRTAQLLLDADYTEGVVFEKVDES